MTARSYWLNTAKFLLYLKSCLRQVQYQCELQTLLHSRTEITVRGRDQINSLSLVLYCISVNKKCSDVECILTSESYNLKLGTSRTILENF